MFAGVAARCWLGMRSAITGGANNSSSRRRLVAGRVPLVNAFAFRKAPEVRVIMRIRILTAALAAAVVGCSGSVQTPTQPDMITVPVQFTAAQDGSPQNHHTHLKGDEEVVTAAPGAPTPADSHAQGQAMFNVSADGQSVDYKLIASNIHNVTQAHIHCAPAGTNGPLVVWLYPSTTPQDPATLPKGTGRTDGVLVEGTFTDANVLDRPGGVPYSLTELLDDMEHGRAYVNIHTDDGVAPPNTGPGDFPGGEIRGDIR